MGGRLMSFRALMGELRRHKGTIGGGI